MKSKSSNGNGSGKRVPTRIRIPIPGSNFTVPADIVVLAVALDTHAVREETELFNPLGARAETARHLVDMMELVHDEVRSLFEEIESAPDPVSKMWTILEMTEAHFVREEQELFPLAETLLGPQELEREEPEPGKKGVKL